MSGNVSVLGDAKTEAILNRLHGEADQQMKQLVLRYLPNLPRVLAGKGIKWDKSKTDFYKDKYIPLDRDQGQFIYLLARSINATTVVEFGTSYGISTIYLAAAVRDNGGGKVIGTEIVTEKVVQAKKNIAEADLEDFVEIREGDALETLKDLDQIVDLVLVDGWAHLALDVLKVLDPFIRKGGVVISDNVGTFKDALKPYVEFLQDPSNGYRSSTLQLKGGTEFSVKAV
jgi:predicted O-methyltransferase YrrM